MTKTKKGMGVELILGETSRVYVCVCVGGGGRRCRGWRGRGGAGRGGRNN